MTSQERYQSFQERYKANAGKAEAAMKAQDWKTIQETVAEDKEIGREYIKASGLEAGQLIGIFGRTARILSVTEDVITSDLAIVCDVQWTETSENERIGVIPL